MKQNDKWLKQIPEKIGWYLTGFADGEGSFYVSLRRKQDYVLRWQICPSFNVAQRDRTILVLFKRYLKCGTLRARKDGVIYYEVLNIRSLKEIVIPFFERFNFFSNSKKTNFRIFCQIVDMATDKKHLEKEGLKEILLLREKLNKGRGRKRKYNLNDVFQTKWLSSETIRQTS